MLNKVILIGRLTREPELRYTPSGAAVAKFTLAVDRRQSRDREKETDFIDIVVWQKLAETCASYLGKGRLVAVDGRLQVRSYEDNQGVRRKAAEVVAENVRFLDRAKEGSVAAGGAALGSEGGGYGSEISFNEDDIPF
ncbi:single-stranded DNA-binding protein [Pelotomaculum propionicicum]|uniref:single-stranded DNA-binding protein n=1 Tax=Pelotomaculum propionicicum TaxID=258475 RepID=UPI003B82A31A